MDDLAASAPGPSSELGNSDLEQSLAQIRDALRTLQFGEVSIIVQDGVVVQIERTERKRLKRRRG